MTVPSMTSDSDVTPTIYLDHAAATPVSDKALAAMLPYFQEQFYNPSAPYLPAKHVRDDYEAAKAQLAQVIGAKSADLVITAGATESINLAFSVMQGIDAAAPVTYGPRRDKAPGTKHILPGKSDAPTEASKRVLLGVPNSPVKVLVLATEHAAVLASARSYACEFVAVDKFGLIDFRDFRAKLDNSVALVSVSLANNELGTIQPLAEIAEVLRAERARRLAAGETLPLYFHTDASQALSLMDINVARLGVDLMTLNAAKCGGPKGIGALYVGHGVKLVPQTLGGGQEHGLRSGTENVPSVVGFATAAQESKSHISFHRKQYQEMAKLLRRELAHDSIVAQISENVKHKPNIASNSVKHKLDSTGRSTKHNPDETANTDAFDIPAPIFLGQPKHQLASFVPVCFPGIDAERLVYRLEAQGVLLSTGAACAANKGTKSHVLAAIGLSDAEIAGSVRISLGATNDLAQIQSAARLIRAAVAHEYLRTWNREQRHE